MIRTLTALSVLSLAVATAVPAFAAPSVVVSLTGKTAAQAYADIADAARAVCKMSSPIDRQMIGAPDSCVADTIAATVSKVRNPALSEFARSSGATILVASN